MSKQSKWASWQQLVAESVPTVGSEPVFEVAPEMKEWVESTAVESEDEVEVNKKIELTTEESEPKIDLKKITKTKK